MHKIWLAFWVLQQLFCSPIRHSAHAHSTLAHTHSHTHLCRSWLQFKPSVCVFFFFFGLSHTRLRGKYTRAFSFIYRLIAMQADKTWDVDDDDNYSTTRRNKNKQTNTQTDRQTTKRKGRGRRVGKRRGGERGEELGRCSKNSLLHWQGKHLESFFLFSR